MKNVETYFTDHPAKNEVFETSDGFLFHQDGDAALHAKSLKDHDITMHKRKAAEVAEAAGEPLITEVKEHAVKTEGGEGKPAATILPESIQVPVTPEVAEKVEGLIKATGEPATTTAELPTANQMPQVVNGEPKAKTKAAKTKPTN